MSLVLLFFIALGAFVVFLCVLGLVYRGGSEQLLDFSADRVRQRRAAAEALDLQTLIEATNRSRLAEGLEPLSEEDVRREAERQDSF